MIRRPPTAGASMTPEFIHLDELNRGKKSSFSKAMDFPFSVP